VSVAVNLVSASAVVVHGPGGAGPRDIISAIEDAGFEAALLPPGAPRPGGAEAPLAREARAWRARLVLSALLSAPVMVLSMAGMVPAWMPVIDAPSPLLGGLPWSWVVQAVFSTAVQVVVGAAFYRSAWAGLKRREPNMQVWRQREGAKG
jgi:Cu+-exporting ATPase